MKISTFLLSAIGLCVLYVCYADWIDDILDVLAENYLGTDYEEVPPFIPTGTEEFDTLTTEELAEPSKTRIGSIFVAVALAAITLLTFLARLLLFGKGLDFMSQYVLPDDDGKSQKRRKIGKKSKRGRKGEDLPVQVIWKGNTPAESSMHCNLKGGTKVHKDIVQAKTGLKSSDVGGGDDLEEITPSSSNESTVQRLAEIRKLLESESEIVRGFADKSAGTEDLSETLGLDGESETEQTTKPSKISHKCRRPCKKGDDSEMSCDEECKDSKLMNRIRLLESKLRLEELKNQNWISRMSRAEGILQQLNRQVERIEQSRPMEATLTETFKITSTVTNWLERPKMNFQFTTVKSCPPQFLPPRFESFSEYVKREIVLPYSFFDSKRIMSLPKSSLVPALPPAKATPQTSILSKLLSK